MCCRSAEVIARKKPVAGFQQRDGGHIETSWCGYYKQAGSYIRSLETNLM
jgi:hypothetical protein